MRFWRSVLLLLLSLSVSLIVFSDVCIEASAADRSIVYTRIERDAGIDIFGSQIPFNVTINGVQSSGTFTLSSASLVSCTSYNLATNNAFSSTTDIMDYVWLVYKANVSPGGNYSDFSIDCPVYFSDSARGAFAISGSGALTNAGSDNLIASYPDNYFNSFYAVSMDYRADSSLANYYGYVQFYYRDTDNYNYYRYFRPIPYDFTGGQQITNIHFEHIPVSSDGSVFFLVCLPYVYGNVSQGVQTTTSTTVTGTDINVNVDVDLDETNGILSTISSILSGLVDGIKGLFVPDASWLSAWYASMVQALYDAFGDIPELNDQITQSIQNLINASAIENFQWPGVNVPGVGQISAPRLVPLKPNPVEFGSLYSFIRIAVNIVATCLVVNMLISKIKAVIVGEVVVVDGD